MKKYFSSVFQLPRLKYLIRTLSLIASFPWDFIFFPSLFHRPILTHYHIDSQSNIISFLILRCELIFISYFLPILFLEIRRSHKANKNSLKNYSITRYPFSVDTYKCRQSREAENRKPCNYSHRYLYLISILFYVLFLSNWIHYAYRIKQRNKI